MGQTEAVSQKGSEVSVVPADFKRKGVGFRVVGVTELSANARIEYGDGESGSVVTVRDPALDSTGDKLSFWIKAQPDVRLGSQ